MRSLLQLLVALFSFMFWPSISAAQTSPQGFTLQGRLVDAVARPLEVSNVIFKVQIRSPGVEDCLLYEEVHNVSMGNSEGLFSLSVGRGLRGGSSAFKDTSSISSVLSNAGSSISSLSRAPTFTSYDPEATHGRKIRVIFDDGTGPQTMEPDIPLEAVPYALYADSLQGKGPADFIQPNGATALSQANLESVFVSNAFVTELLALINGTSSRYTTAAGGHFTPTAALNFNT